MADAGSITLPLTADSVPVGTVTVPVAVTMNDGPLSEDSRTTALVDVTPDEPVWSFDLADHPGCPGDVEVAVRADNPDVEPLGTLVCCDTCRPRL